MKKVLAVMLVMMLVAFTFGCKKSGTTQIC